jgi:chemotaxis signal transduction protein
MDLRKTKRRGEEQLSENTYRAWLLDFGDGVLAAVAFNEMSQVVLSPELFEVPCTPAYCHQVLLLRKRVMPIIDMLALLTGAASPQPRGGHIIGIGVYQEAAGQALRYIGMHLASTPASIIINDNQACELPDRADLWQELAMACFSYENKKIPVLNLAYLFSAEFRQNRQAA